MRWGKRPWAVPGSPEKALLPLGFCRECGQEYFVVAKVTRADVNKAIRRHLSAEKLTVVMITKDAEGLRKELLSPNPTTIAYDAPKPPEVLAEDKLIGAKKLGLTPERIRITPVADVFAR